MILFLALNGQVLKPDKLDAINAIMAVAAGDVDIDDLAAWIRDNTIPR